MTATSSIGSSNDSLAQSMEESDKETTPAEDRERIFRLESAVTWIKQAVENLRESDRTLYQEFENIRSMIQEIQEAQLQEQKKHLNGTFHDRSPSPTELNSEENVSEMLFEEYFGTFLRRKKQGLSTDRPQSLHLPKINGGRNYSQTLV